MKKLLTQILKKNQTKSESPQSEIQKQDKKVKEKNSGSVKEKSNIQNNNQQKGNWFAS
jgi:hypothetical protein